MRSIPAHSWAIRLCRVRRRSTLCIEYARIERALVEHGSPTLAGLKSGSLFCLMTPPDRTTLSQIGAVSAQLEKKGVRLIAAKPLGSRTLCYLYRASQLEQMLADPEDAAFLRPLGYGASNPERAVSRLCERLCACDPFPHEIGLFLGYPLADVLGFIRNSGKNCLCSGCWKAYTNAEAAQKAFDRFSRCTQIYRRLYESGARSLLQLTVSV